MTTSTGTGLKTAAIWARVSTKGQKEISPDTQITQCQQLLKNEGYTATKILSVDYCCLDLAACKEFQQLQGMIERHEVDAVVCYDRDRLMADGIDRLTFITQTKGAGVELLVCNGIPIMNTDEGLIVELSLALGKKRSTLRARSGSRDGLRARVTLKNKPASHQKVFGYDWDKTTETLIPNADYPTVKMIFELALSGNGYLKICHELQNKGIKSPHGSTFGKGNVSSTLHNSVYAGRYMALRSTIVRSDKPGYKLQHIPEAEWHWIKEVKITESPITWEQRGALLEQIQKHIKLSSRNANRQYLLRGMIDADGHYGRQGKNIKYHGHSLPKHDYGYSCDINDRQTHFISGKKLEEAVKAAISNLFECESPSFWQKMTNLQKINRPDLEAELKKQQAKLSKAIHNEAALEVRSFESDMEPEVYELARAKLHVTRMAIEEGLKETQEQLDSAFQIEEKIESFDEIRTKFLENQKNFTEVQWRDLLETLDCRIRIFKPGESDLVSVQDVNNSELINDEAKETVRKILVDSYYNPDSTENNIDSLEMTPTEKFLLNNKSDAVSLLHKFNAIMILKGPYRVPQQIRDIGLAQPWKAFHLYLQYNL